jgi:hypothetical protein
MQIDPVIFVDDDVSHGLHFHPGDFRKAGLHFAGNLPGGFPDNSQISENGVNYLFVFFKPGIGQSLCVPFDFCDAIRNIMHTHFPVLGGMDRLSKNLLTEFLAQGIRCDQIHSATQNFLQVQLQTRNSNNPIG